MRTDGRDRVDLRALAVRAMRERGLLVGFSDEVLNELATLPPVSLEEARDERALRWCSIDNAATRDLDQLSCSERLGDGVIKVRIAIADVAETVRIGSAIDRHAAHNTTSVYTPACIFPMLPERLSIDLTSLNPDVDRCAIVAELDIDARGAVIGSGIHRAQVRNHARLAYDGVAAWLDGQAAAPAAVAGDPALAEQLRDQDEVAQRLRGHRRELGALDLDTTETRAVLRDGIAVDMRLQGRNRARQLIEDLMIAANVAAARFLADRGWASIRRVVRTPARWDRIVDLAAGLGCRLPVAPD